MSYIKDTKDIIFLAKEFIVDFTKTLLYYGWSFVMGVKNIIQYILAIIFPVIIKELKASSIEFGRILNSILYVIAYESANLLSALFLNLGKACFALADQFDRLARFLFPKSINLN